MNSKTASHTALDRSDERVRHDEGLFGALRAQITRIKTGDLDTAPKCLETLRSCSIGRPAAELCCCCGIQNDLNHGEIAPAAA
ncbi:hypothetical protein ACSLOS_16450, partial [Klebsiella pneumoniae]